MKMPFLVYDFLTNFVKTVSSTMNLLNEAQRFDKCYNSSPLCLCSNFCASAPLIKTDPINKQFLLTNVNTGTYLLSLCHFLDASCKSPCSSRPSMTVRAFSLTSLLSISMWSCRSKQISSFVPNGQSVTWLNSIQVEMHCFFIVI